MFFFLIHLLLCQMLLHSGRQACRQSSVQSSAVQVFSLMNLSLWRWIGSGRRASAEPPFALEEDLWWPLFLSSYFSSSLILFLSSAPPCSRWITGESKTQRKSIRPVSLQKLFEIFLILFLEPILGSRDMGGAGIKGIMLGLSLFHTWLCMGVFLIKSELPILWNSL